MAIFRRRETEEEIRERIQRSRAALDCTDARSALVELYVRGLKPLHQFAVEGHADMVRHLAKVCAGHPIFSCGDPSQLPYQALWDPWQKIRAYTCAQCPGFNSDPSGSLCWMAWNNRLPALICLCEELSRQLRDRSEQIQRGV